MASFNEHMQKAVAPGPDRIIAGCVLIASHNGLVHQRCYGTASVDPLSPHFNKPITTDTPMWIASCTKLATAIAVLQCVEKNLLKLEDDISIILTDRKQLKILLGYDDISGEPILEDAKRKINARLLLTHSSGLSADFNNEKAAKYIKYLEKQGKLSDLDHFSAKLDLPLFFEPGTDWEYGVSSDWAGELVERLTNQRLGQYMEQHIFKPLGMDTTTFRLADRPDMVENRADMSRRDQDGMVVPSLTRFYPDDEPKDLGGGGLYASSADYFKLLSAVIRNDGLLLKPETMELLFEPCLSPSARATFQTARSVQHGNLDDGKMPLPAPASLDFALGGMVAMEAVPGGRHKGSLAWGGLPNLNWMIDRDSGVVTFFASQLLPPSDQETIRLIRRFEAAVYSNEFFQKNE